MESPLLGIAIGLFLGVNVGIITMAMLNAALRDELSESAPEHRRADRASGPDVRAGSRAGIAADREGDSVAGVADPTHRGLATGGRQSA